MNYCPFFGRAGVPVVASENPELIETGGKVLALTLELFPTGGNQCALILASHAPCAMEVNGQAPDWRACPLLKMPPKTP